MEQAGEEWITNTLPISIESNLANFEFAAQYPTAARGASLEPRLIRDLESVVQTAVDMQRGSHQAEAVELYKAVLRRNPTNPEVLRLLGVAYAQMSKFDSALRMLQASLRYGPDTPETHNNLGRVFQSLQRYEEAIACYERAVELRSDYAVALNNLGTALAALNRHGEAIERYQRALEAQPDYPQALGNIGISHHALEQHQEALDYLTASLNFQPNSIEILVNLAKVQERAGRNLDALQYLNMALEVAPQSAQLQSRIASIFHKLGKHSDAIYHYRVTLEIEYEHAETHAALGSILEEVGQIAEAIDCYRTAIALNPRHPSYYLRLSRMAELKSDDPLLAAMLSMKDEIESLTENEKIDLHFALGASLDRLGEHERAFAHWLAGNAMQRKLVAYDENASRLTIDRMRESFAAPPQKTRTKVENQTISPIFIVGMPRSGSTLVEQVLASHPSVFAAGEIPDLSEAIRKARLNSQFSPYLKTVGACADRHLEEFAQGYLDLLTARLRSADEHRPISHITDKMLGNFRYIGLIFRAIPNARIIHTKRNPIDTCISCFSLRFNRVEFSYDLGELGRYYASYEKLMQYWHSILPTGAILDVQYENTVEDLEMQARRILDHCGLEWHDACLQFYQTDRPVRTSSLIQVRRPIYKSSVGRWRPERAILQPLLDGLSQMHMGGKGGGE